VQKKTGNGIMQLGLYLLCHRPVTAGEAGETWGHERARGRERARGHEKPRGQERPRAYLSHCSLRDT
jgi:hypothetical protein